MPEQWEVREQWEVPVGVAGELRGVQRPDSPRVGLQRGVKKGEGLRTQWSHPSREHS